MKNLVLLVLVFMATVCSAQIELESNEEGVYRVKDDAQEWAPSGVTAEHEAIKYIDKFPQAIAKPGVPILVEQSDKILKLKPVFKKLVETEKQFIVYKEERENIIFFVKTETREESSYLILFSIASILLMIISNILFKRGYNNAAAIAAIAAIAATIAIAAIAATIALAATFAAAAALAFAAAAALALALAAAAALAFAAALAAATTAFAAAAKDYKAASIIFYIAMTIHIICLFI